jgi:hypothetical protein
MSGLWVSVDGRHRRMSTGPIEDDVKRRLNAAEYYPSEIECHDDCVEFVFAGGVHDTLELERTAWAAAGSRDRVTKTIDDRGLVITVDREAER